MLQEERALREQFLYEFEELARYYQVLGQEFTCLYTYLGVPFSVHTGSTSQSPPTPPSDTVTMPPYNYLVESPSPPADARASQTDPREHQAVDPTQLLSSGTDVAAHSESM